MTNRENSIKQNWEEKEQYEYFQWETKEIEHEINRKWLRRGNLKRETESTLIAAQNNDMTNYVKAKIDDT